MLVWAMSARAKPVSCEKALMTNLRNLELKTVIKQILYRSTALGALHRLRNGNTLTVLMFHRVIAPGAPAWQGANPLFTMSTTFFEQFLRFLKAHYSPVGLADVARASSGEARLPPRALLVTFDDGWADNAEFAAPLLKEAGVPALFFLATGAIKSGEAFWQEKFFAWAMSAGDRSAKWQTLMGSFEGSIDLKSGFLEQIAQIIETTERRGGAANILMERLDGLDAATLPQMMAPEDITRLAEDPLFEIGAHGVSHTPLPHVSDVVSELEGAWDDLSQWCTPSAKSLSFPHGQYTTQILKTARSLGYDLLFDSEQILNSVDGSIDNGECVPPLGRFEVRPESSDADPCITKFDAERVATEMFLRPVQRPFVNLQGA